MDWKKRIIWNISNLTVELPDIITVKNMYWKYLRIYLYYIYSAEKKLVKD